MVQRINDTNLLTFFLFLYRIGIAKMGSIEIETYKTDCIVAHHRIFWFSRAQQSKRQTVCKVILQLPYQVVSQ